MSLSVGQGEFFGLLGPNDTDKIMLISILADLNRVNSGSVRVLDHDIAFDHHTAHCKPGAVPQELVFDPFFTVRETLHLQSGYSSLTKNDDWINEVMANLDLTNKVDANMRVFSGGMKRRVLVAQTLVHRPPVIVLDGSIVGVDIELCQTLWKFISRLNREGHIIVLTTYCPEEAKSPRDRIAMLKFGEVVTLDCTANLLSQLTGLQLVLSFAKGVLPVSLESLHLPGSHSERGVRPRLSGYGKVEQIPSTCRPAGCETDDMEVAKADLGDIFMQIVRHESGLPLGPQASTTPNSALEPAA